MNETNTQRIATWGGIGTNVNTNSIDEVLKLAKLDYTVDLQPVFTKIGEKEVDIPSRRAVVRNDGHVYNTVSSSYVPIQNKEAFDFLHSIDSDIRYVKGGETAGGLIYIIGELREMDILGDKFKLYAIFQNSHNARYQLAATICPLRIVCQNQFNISFKESESTILIRHTKNIGNKVAVAAETLRNINEYTKSFEEHAKKFAQQKITPDGVEKFLDFMFPERPNMTQASIERLELEKAKFMKAYNTDDNQNFQGTAWGLINGLTDYITHSTFTRKVENADEKKFVSTILDPKKLNNAITFIGSSMV